MPNNALQQLKQARSSIKTERLPVSQVQEALKETKEITQFVKTTLSEDNRWILQSGESESIITMLNDIIKTNKILYTKCRTPHHFEQNAVQFLSMKNKISHNARCIHLSLDQGFYDTEPLGFSPGKAVELSLNQIKSIRNGVDQGLWNRLPIHAPVSDSIREQVAMLITEAEPLAAKLVNRPNLKSFEPPLSIEEIKVVYQYFQKVRKIIDLEQQGLTEALSINKKTKALTLEEILKELYDFEGKLDRVRLPQANNFPKWGTILYELSKNDLSLRMDLIRIPFEPLGFLSIRAKKLKEQKASIGMEQAVADFHNNATQESEHLQLFIETFQGVDAAFEEVTTILKNLSISFGKIYHSASSKTLSNVFLGKALGLIKGLLEKAERVSESKSQKLFSVQEKIQKLKIFDTPINDGMNHILQQIDKGIMEMKNYRQLLDQYIQTITSATDWDSRQIYSFLQKAYDERTKLTATTMVFGSVSQTASLIIQTLTDIDSRWKQLADINQQGLEGSELFEKTLELLEKIPEYPEESLIQSTEKLEELNWILSEMLVRGPDEEVRFVEELKNELQAAKIRIQVNKKKAESKTKVPVPESNKTQTKKNETGNTKVELNLKKKTPISSTSSKVIPKKENYDPFDSGKMVALKTALKEMESEQASMLLYVLTHNHMFFTQLTQLEKVYITDTTSEYQLEQLLEKSKKTIDFLTRFAKYKFLTKGYYSSNDVQFEYLEDEKRFDILPGVERFLKLNKSTINQPKEVYTRLIRVLLGLDDSKTISSIMPRQVLSILQEDLRLPSEEQKLAENAFRLG